MRPSAEDWLARAVAEGQRAIGPPPPTGLARESYLFCCFKVTAMLTLGLTGRGPGISMSAAGATAALRGGAMRTMSRAPAESLGECFPLIGNLKEN